MLSRVGWKYRQQTLLRFALVSTKTKNTLRSLHSSNIQQCPATTATQQCALTKILPEHENYGHARAGDIQSQEHRRRDPDPPLPSSLIDLASTTLASHVNLEVLSLQIRSSQLLSGLFSNRERVRALAESLAQSSLPEQSLKALSVAHYMGNTPKKNAYECVAFQFALAREWTWLRRTVSLAKRHRGRLTVRLLNWRIRALLRTQCYHLLDSTFDMFAEQGLSPNRLTFHMLICGHICNHDLMRAKKTMQAMQEAGFPIDASTSAAISTVYRSMGFHPDVERAALKSLAEISSSVATTVLNSLIQLRLDAHDCRGALQLVSRFDQRTVAGIIRVVSGEGFTPVEGDTPGVTPNDATFAMFVTHLAKSKTLDGIHDIISGMLDAGIPMSSLVISSLIIAYSKTGDISTPLRIVRKMCDVPQKLWDIFSDDFKQSLHLPFYLEQIELNVRVFNSLLRAILSQRDISQAVAILQIMSHANISPDHATVEILLTHLDKREGADSRDLLCILPKLVPRDAIRVNMQHIHVILRSLIRRERFLVHGAGWNKSAVKFSKVRVDDSSPSAPTTAVTDPFDPTAGLSAPDSAAGVRSLLLPWVQSLFVRGVRSGSATIALRLRRDAVNKGDLDSARQVLDTLIARGIAPNEYHFAALIEGYTLAGDMKTAHELLEMALCTGVRPNVVLYTIFISGYARLGRPREALRTFQEMVRMGVKPDVPAIDAISSAFFISGYYRLAKRVLLSLWPHIGTLPEGAQTASLQDLARQFRLLHEPNQGKMEKDLTMRERQQLSKRVHKLLDAWAPHNSSRKGRVGSRRHL